MIRKFEPRFKSVRVKLLDNTDPTDRALRLRIDALLYAEPAPSRWSSTRSWSPVSGNFRGRGSGRMSDELLPYYNRELAFLRQSGRRVRRGAPEDRRAACGWGPDAVKDPHVARLIEAFAYLNARTRHKLDDDFPEVSEALLGVAVPALPGPAALAGDRPVPAGSAAGRADHRLYPIPRGRPSRPSRSTASPAGSAPVIR